MPLIGGPYRQKIADLLNDWIMFENERCDYGNDQSSLAVQPTLLIWNLNVYDVRHGSTMWTPYDLYTSMVCFFLVYCLRFERIKCVLIMAKCWCTCYFHYWNGICCLWPVSSFYFICMFFFISSILCVIRISIYLFFGFFSFSNVSACILYTHTHIEKSLSDVWPSNGSIKLVSHLILPTDNTCWIYEKQIINKP